MQSIWRRMCADPAIHRLEQHWVDRAKQGEIGHNAMTMHLRHASSLCAQDRKAAVQADIANRIRKRRAVLSDKSKHLDHIFRKLRGPPAGTLNFMRDEHGVFQASCSALDQILRGAWRHVYGGVTDDQAVQLANYMLHYGHDLFIGTPFHVDPLRPHDLKATAWQAANTAAGIDG